MAIDFENLSNHLEAVLSSFYVVRLNFEAVFLDSGPLEPWPMQEPYLPAVILRDGWGTHLKDLCCDQNKRVCPNNCECAYRTVFRSSAEHRYESLSATEQIPRPYIIKTDLMTGAQVKMGQFFRFSLLLIGEASNAIEPSVIAFFKLADSGIGRHRHGTSDREVFRRFRVVSVKAVAPEGEMLLWESTQPNRNKVPKPVALKRLREAMDFSSLPNRELALTIDFLSPTSFGIEELGKKVSPSRLNAQHFANAAYMRIIRLWEIWCGNKIKKEKLLRFDELTDEKIPKIGSLNRYRYTYTRQSRKEKNTQHLRGWLGTVTFRGDIGPLYYLLIFCRPLGIGQNTIDGFGHYRLILHA